MRKRRRSRRALSEINVVPYIDVMLVLLIIFMVTTPLLSQGVKVDLPHASAQPLSAQDTTPLIVTVDAEGHYFLNVLGDAPVTSDVIMNRVEAALSQNPDRKVYVRGDQSVAYGKVVEAMVFLQQAGVPQVGLMTDPNSHETA